MNAFPVGDWERGIPPDRFVQAGEQLWLSLTLEKIHFFDPKTELAIFP
jgi:multiple sugar transport system ATP-binding protein